MVVFIVRGVMWLYALLEGCYGYIHCQRCDVVICIIRGVLWLYSLSDV